MQSHSFLSYSLLICKPETEKFIMLVRYAYSIVYMHIQALCITFLKKKTFSTKI